MRSLTDFPPRLALIGVLALGAGGAAQAATVGRCNLLIDGVYTPVLEVTTGTGRSIHRIGSDGLTRSILFDAGKALAWAAALYGADDLDYADRCSDASAGSEEAGLPLPPPPPAPADPGEDDPCGPPSDPCGPPSA